MLRPDSLRSMNIQHLFSVCNGDKNCWLHRCVYVPRSAGLLSCACSKGSVPSALRGQTCGPCSVRSWVLRPLLFHVFLRVVSCILLPICQDVARTGFKQYMGRPSSDEVAIHVLRDQMLLIGTVGRSLGCAAGCVLGC